MLTIPADHTFTMRLRVTSEMTARFFDCEIHPVYATFAIVEHAEYAARQAILPFLDKEEDAVGTSVEIEHMASAPVGAIVEITAQVIEVTDRSILCQITVSSRAGVIARGKQQQRVVSKQRLRTRITELYATDSTESSNEN